MRISCVLVLGAVLSLHASVIAAQAATQERRAAPAEVAADPSVLLMPFQAIGDAGVMPWLGQAIQQNVLNELSRGTGLDPVVPPKDTAAVSDADSARKAADAQKARFVLYGSFHAAGRDLRITGQILDVKSNRHIGGVKATGSTRDLFLLEDTIASQARRILLAAVPAAAPAAPAPADEAVARADDDLPDPGEFPWDKDRYTIQDAREQLILDRYNFTASYDRWRYYPDHYGFYSGYGLYGYYPWYSGFNWRQHRHHHHHKHGTTFGRYRGGLTFFPGGIARGRLRAIPGGVINVGYW
jgi:TolB-like protein